MGCDDLMDQRTAYYRLDCKSSVRFYQGGFYLKPPSFYLRIFFDLTGIACVNSYTVQNIRETLTSRIFQTVRSFSQRILFNGIKVDNGMFRHHDQIQSSSSDCDGSHLLEFQQTRKRCVYCASNGKEKRTYETDIASEAPSCLVKDRKTILGYIHAI